MEPLIGSRTESGGRRFLGNFDRLGLLAHGAAGEQKLS